MLLLFFFLLVYSTLSWYLATNFRIIFDKRIPWDAYFSFDNKAIVTTGGGFERHPFSNYWFYCIKKLAFWFSDGKVNGTFRFVLAEMSTIAISFSILYVFKFLKNIIELSTKEAFVFCLFYGFFSTNIMLSFTPETYTYSALFIVFFFYYSFSKLKSGRHLHALDYLISGIVIGGLTITNFAKTFIPLFFDRVFYKSWKNFWDSLLKVSLSFTAFVLLYLYRLDFDYLRIISKTGTQYEKFTKARPIALWDMALSWFFGGNILFSSFGIRNYHAQKFEFKALFMELYTSGFSYAFVVVVLLIVLLSWWRNRKNNWVNILMISLLFDCFIHLVLGFGTASSYIYGGHFVFVLLFMLAYFYESFRYNLRWKMMLNCLLLVLGFYMIANNLYRMHEFLNYCSYYYT